VKAAYIESTGPPETIQFGELSMPELTAAQVLVRVKAGSVNPIDTYIRAGMVPFALPKPFIVGCDLAGIVERVGAQVRRFKPGDRVWGSNQGLLGRQGTFAEFAAVDESWLYPTPGGVRDEDAAAIALVGITAHLGLFRCAHIQAGETVFVNGGSGGVGSMVIQMAKAIGARVIAAAGSDAKVERCLELGADHGINYKTQEVVPAVKSLVAEGVNVWWETTREPNLEKAISALAPRGRLVLMAGRDARPVFPIGPFYVKDCSIHGFAMFNASPTEQQSCAEDINRWLAQGKLRANIDRILPLAETAAAHRLQEANTIGKAGTLTGKIVVTP
jgi:NADPH2:quinone reductase